MNHGDPRRSPVVRHDGTLVSSLESVDRCWTTWAQEYGITAEDFARVELHGRPAAETAADLLPAGLVREAVARIETVEVEDVAGSVAALSGTLALLAQLPPERWAVVTSATRRLAEARLGEVGITPKTTVAADDVTRGKPDPEPYLLAARRPGGPAARRPGGPAPTRSAVSSSRTPRPGWRRGGPPACAPWP